MYHVGKVLMVYGKSGEKVEVTVKFWDESLFITDVLPAIQKKIREGVYVLVDYAPSPGLNVYEPLRVTSRILSDQEGKLTWDLFKDSQDKKNEKKKPDSSNGVYG